MHSLTPRLSLLALALCSASATTHATEVYGAAGLPGLMVGLAHPLNEQFTLRADLAGAGHHTRDRVEEGISYQGQLKTGRFALFGDWFPMGGAFRVTAGLSSNHYRLSLDASGAGRTVQVGSGTYVLGPGDGLAMNIRFPSTTPYLGIGWGHQLGETGWRFHADMGAMIGQTRVSATPRGALAADAAKDDVAQETAELRDGVGKVKALPQLSLGVGYAF